MAEILNYTGNANLAAGSAGAGAGTDLGVINLTPAINSFKGLMDRKNAVADANWNQKLRDRDRSFAMIANLQADIDKVLPEDREAMRSKIDNIQTKLLNPNVFEDKNAFGDLQKDITDFTEKNAYAKTNYITVNKDKADAAKETDDRIRESYTKHIQEQRDKIKSDPYALYEPFKQPVKLDLNAIMKPAKTVSKVVGENGFYDTVVNYTDPNEMDTNYNFDRVNGQDVKIHEQWDDFTNSYLSDPSLSADDRVNDMKSWNEKIAAANKYKTGEKFKEIKYDSTGKPVFDATFTKRDFEKAAYVAHSFNETTFDSYSEDRAKLAKTKSEIFENMSQGEAAKVRANADTIRALSDRAVKGSVVRLNDAKTKKVEKDLQDNGDTYSWAYVAASLPRHTLVAGKKQEPGRLLSQNNMPVTLQQLLGEYGKTGKPLDPAWTDKKTGEHFYFTQERPGTYIFPDGRITTDDEINQTFEQAKENDNYKGSFEQFKNDLLKDFKAQPDIIIQGKNGEATSLSILSQQRLRANQSISGTTDTNPEYGPNE